MKFSIQPMTSKDKDWILEFFRGGGADFIVTRGRKVYPTEIEGYCAVDESGEKAGLITYEVIGNQCEIVTIDAFKKFSGIGTALIDKVKQEVQKRGCKRLWLITTNDNLDAVRFYQRRGFIIAAVHVNALEHSRKMKPSIPVTGIHGIPLRDEIEFEMML